MSQTIAQISLVVRDYDEAIAFFMQSLSFDLIEDTPSTDREGRNKRWVLIAPRASRGAQILLAKASNPEEASRIGNQTGGRVFLFLYTDDFWGDYNAMREKGVRFVREPKEESVRNCRCFRRSLRKQMGPAPAQALNTAVCSQIFSICRNSETPYLRPHRTKAQDLPSN